MIRVSEDISRPSGTLIVPSRQRAEALRLAIARASLGGGRRVWPTPDILPAATWLQREIEASAATAALPRLLSAAQEWLIWRQCAAQFTADLELVARGVLAEGLRRADELASEYCIPLQGLSAAAATEGRLLQEVRRAVYARYAGEGATSVHALASELAHVGTERPVEFAGFGTLPPILQRISRAREARRYATRMRAAALPERHAQRIVSADRAEELERIAAWCRALLVNRPEARALVVLPGAAGPRERLATLLRQNLDPRGWVAAEEAESALHSLVAIEGGEPLARAPMVAHALTALSVLTSATPFEALSAWLCAPYWRDPDAAARARVDLLLRASAPLELDLALLVTLLTRAPGTRHAASATAARALAARLGAAAAHLEARSGTPREWAVRIRGALDALHWPGESVRLSDEKQTLQRFNELLDEFGELAVAARHLGRDQALQIFAELAARCRFRPASGDALVTITPRLEDPIVRYDGVWVAGLDASAWPQPVQVNPFLPVAAQRSAGIAAASAQGRTAQARALMLAWRAAADDLVLSFATREGDLELLPSPLLADWVNDASSDASRAVWLPARLHRRDQLESLIDATGPLWPAAEPLPSGTRLLELQSQCAFHAFGELRLGSRELDVPEPGVPALVRGIFLHSALEELWRGLADSQSLKALARDALSALIAKSVAHAARELWGATLTRAQARESARARELLAAVCELERTRAPFRVRDIELAASVTLAGARLDVRIDRVDELAAGGLAILDYKSGTHKTMKWYGEHLSHPQLLGYLAALNEDVRAVATVNVAPRDVGFHGIAVQANLLPRLAPAVAPEGVPEADAWLHSRQLWRARIEALLRDFLSGHAAVDPAPQACRHCDVVSLCRIADRGTPEEEEEDIEDTADD